MIWQLILLQVVTFGILVFLLRMFLYNQITHSQERLERLVQENRKREQELKEKGEALDTEMRNKTAEHSARMTELKEAVEAEAQKRQEEIIQEAQREAQKLVAEAEAQRERIKSQLVAEMEEKALTLAAEIIGCVFSAEVAKAIHVRFTDELLEEIEKSNGLGFPPDAEAVEVSVPFSLGETQLEKLKEVFAAKMGRTVEVRETLVPELMTGMVVRLGNSVLDGSLRNKLKGALAHVKGSLAR